MHNLHTSKPAVSMGQTVGAHGTTIIILLCMSSTKKIMSVLGVVCHYESTQLRPLPNIHNNITAASLEIVLSHCTV